MTSPPDTEPVLPDWVQALIKPLGVELLPFGCLNFRADQVIWACTGDCCCWFLFDSSDNWTGVIDRYSFVNEDGWCQGQNCPCHQLPRSVNLEELRREDVEALKASIDTKGQ